MIDRGLSRRFSFANTVSLFAVVAIHAKLIMSRWEEGIDITSVAGRVSWFIQYILSENIARIAVPVFFFVSGYFFATGLDGTIRTHLGKLKKRAKSVLIPYLIFCLLWALPYTLISKNIDIADIFLHPVPFQFWFLQHLMILMLLTYVIFKFRKWLPYISGVLGLIYVISHSRWGGFEESLFFFTLGLCCNSRHPDFLRQIHYSILFPVFILLVALGYFSMETSFSQILHHFMVLTGATIVIKWIFTGDRAPQLVIPAALSFFIFAVHEPLLGIIKSFALKYNFLDSTGLLAYFVLPMAAVLICVAIYKLTELILPAFLKILTGGRPLR